MVPGPVEAEDVGRLVLGTAVTARVGPWAGTVGPLGVGTELVTDAEVHLALPAREEDVLPVSGVDLDVSEELSLGLALCTAHHATEDLLGMGAADVILQGLAIGKALFAVETGHVEGQVGETGVVQGGGLVGQAAAGRTVVALVAVLLVFGVG